jgi:hypothetical protein
MTDAPKLVEVRGINPDEIMVMICPGCDHKKTVSAKLFASGFTHVCDGCGKVFYSAGNSVGSWMEFEVPWRRGDTTLTVKTIVRLDGGWVVLDEGEKSIITNLDSDSERATAVMIGSMIENRLKRAILTKLRHGSKKMTDFLFQASGPLGSFRAKIDLACIMGMLSLEAHKDLSVFKDIRNAFAHDLSIRDFSSQSIRDKAATFQLIDSYVAEVVRQCNGGELFFDLGPAAKPCIFAKHAAQRLTQAKFRYLFMAQLITAKFVLCDDPLAPWPLL